MNATFTDPLGGLPAARWDEIAGPCFYGSALSLRLCALATGSTCGGVHVELTSRGLPAPDERGVLIGARRGYLTELFAGPSAIHH